MKGKHYKGAVLTALVAGFLMVAAYRRGLYFEQDFFALQVVLDVLGLGAVLYLWLRGEVRSVAKLFALLLMSAAYLLPLVFTRVSVEGTLEEVLHWGSYGAWMLLIYWFARSPRHRQLLRWGLWSVGLFLGGGMLAGFYGLFHFQNLYVISHDVRFTTLGVRFSGFFQYANTFAIVTGAFLLQQLVWLVQEKRRVAASLHAAPLVAYGMVILLSESRGAWLVLALGWLVGWWVLSAQERSRYVLVTISLSCTVLLAYQQFVSAFTRQAGHFPGLVVLVVATVVFVLCVIAERTVQWRARNGRRVLYIGSAIAGVLVISLALWRSDALLQRGLHHFESAVARKLFYRDAVDIFLGSPWIGWGGSSWRMLFRQYQQYPYVGNEVHSSLISLGLDVGVVGLLVFVVIMYRLLKPLVVRKSPVVPALFVLLGHSLFDVDTSFGFYWLFVLLLIGGSLASVETSSKQAQEAPSPFRVQWQRHAIAAASLTVLTACLICVVHFELGQLAFENAGHAKSESEVNSDLQQAIKWNPYSIPYRLEWAHHLEKAHDETQALPLLQTGLSFEPHNAVLLWEIGNVYWATNQPEQMVAFMKAAIQNDRFDTEKQENYLLRLQQMAKQEFLQGNRQEATRLATEADVAFTKYAGLDTHLKEMPYRVNDRKFAVTEPAKFEAAQSYVLLCQYGKAEQLFQELTTSKTEQMRKNADFELNLVQNIEARVKQGTLQREDAYGEYLTQQ